MENENELNDINDTTNHQHYNIVLVIGRGAMQSTIQQLQQIANQDNTFLIMDILDQSIPPTILNDIPKIGQPVHPWQNYYKNPSKRKY